MKTPTLRRAVLPGVAALALALTACGSSDEDGGDVADDVSLSGQYTIGGASTQEAAMTAWSVGFTDVQPEAEVTYEPIGSGGGRENFVAGGYPLAGSDAYLDNDEGELDAAIERCGGAVEHSVDIFSEGGGIAILHNLCFWSMLCQAQVCAA